MPILDARYYKTLLICPNRPMGVELAPLLSVGLPNAPVSELSDYPTRKQLYEVTKSFEPKICFLDVTSDYKRAFELFAELSGSGSLPVVALLAGNDPDLMLRCIRHGSSDFLVRPFTSDQIDAVVEKIARLYPAPVARPGSGGKVVAVIPVKGACGASTIATNLTFQSRKLGAKKVLLADLDAITGSVSFLLKLKHGFSFLDLLNRPDAMDAGLWKQIVTSTQGIDVLLPPEHFMEGLDELPDATLVIESAQQMYDIVVVDCGGPFGNWNLSIARSSHEVLLVTTNELPALQAAQRVLAYYDMMRIDASKLRVVVNRYEREIGLTSDSIGAALQIEPFHLIPSDWDAVQKSQLDGKPIQAGTTFGKNIVALAQRLRGEGSRDDSDRASPLSGILSIFSRAQS
ncbi:MAG: AAA family ATPase [Acidobacteria bacterium]|nr:AAA family ATPase [Acidobacteriota bacterium]MBI3281592.1 AAA family ATPase [Acidobacteriota bacterium]